MDQFNNGINNNTPPTMPEKRKPGRPRKDKSLKKPKKNKSSLNYQPPLNSVGETNSSFVGQPVTGVIEASFDAGFLLNVNIGNSGTCLRGIVFKPGHYCPISAENDVVPHIQMVNRNEIALPKENRNGEYIGNIGGIGNGQLLHSKDLFTESTTLKGNETSTESPFSFPSKGMVKPVVIEPFISLNQSFQQQGNSESAESDKIGNLLRTEANKQVEISSQSLNGHLAIGDDKNNRLDIDPLPFLHSADNMSQDSLGPFSNNRIGPMSMLLQQVVQEQIVKPGDSS